MRYKNNKFQARKLSRWFVRNLEICYFYISQTKLRLNKIFYKVVYHRIIYMCDFFCEFRCLFCRGLHGFSWRLWFALDMFPWFCGVQFLNYWQSFFQKKTICFRTGRPMVVVRPNDLDSSSGRQLSALGLSTTPSIVLRGHKLRLVEWSFARSSSTTHTPNNYAPSSHVLAYVIIRGRNLGKYLPRTASEISIRRLRRIRERNEKDCPRTNTLLCWDLRGTQGPGPAGDGGNEQLGFWTSRAMIGANVRRELSPIN